MADMAGSEDFVFDSKELVTLANKLYMYQNWHIAINDETARERVKFVINDMLAEAQGLKELGH
jgi:hypothetical protein